MLTPTTILLVIAVSLVMVAAWAAFRASGQHTSNIPIWPAAVAFGLAIALFGMAAVTA
ncbi:hypothetical protein [Brachybacterium alimentarium]|uniref:hypothetical protein n=1 Tax=Brachybacterium alimentarium TaxID=47845 RepID=UPI0015CDD7DA|nr:hypothetical protein [Brachybacterium alimentarium]